MRWSHCVLVVLLVWLALPGQTQARKEKKIPDQVHVVRRGESLSSIAEHYQLSVAQLRKANRLRGDQIRVGQRLKLPPFTRPAWHRVDKGETLVGIARLYRLDLDQLRQFNLLSDDRILVGQRLRLSAPESTLTAQPAAPPLPPPTAKPPAKEVPRPPLPDSTLAVAVSDSTADDTAEAADSTAQEGPDSTATAEEETLPPLDYLVQKGESLVDIARRFDLPPGLLRQLNNLKKDRLRPGQKLRLRPSALDEGTHIVRPGQTLTGIARSYRLDVEKLRELNGLDKDGRILVGQKLRLRPTAKDVHIVERGDALWEIASAYGIDAEELKKLNGLDSEEIYPGQELKLSPRKADTFALYRVEPGDNLSEIARLHQMSVPELRRLNKIKGAVIHPGARLKVRPILGDTESLQTAEVNWDSLRVPLRRLGEIESENGPYYRDRPKAPHQLQPDYYENPSLSPIQAYERSQELWQAFAGSVEQLPPLSSALKGWNFVLDPGHGGLDPGAVVQVMDGNGNKVFVVEDEYVYDIAVRVYILLRRHGAQAGLTLLSPNHLLRHSNPAAQTFVNEKNEVYNSREFNEPSNAQSWPRGGRGGNLNARVHIAEKLFGSTPENRRIFLSFHADIDPQAPEAPLVLYYQGKKTRRDLVSRNCAHALLPALGAGAHMRGQSLAVLRNNPAGVKVLLELRNLAYTDHGWALRFEQLRQRDAEKVVKGILEYVSRQALSSK
ncbi:MAG: LysM peptidoglycan-binding domain-containing protein [Candidatus Latescibacteria bacterium]|nr:LysM peptidoglycan-binding domain-containing protein [Candidatus Latescibacterota bacterium]